MSSLKPHVPFCSQAINSLHCNLIQYSQDNGIRRIGLPLPLPLSTSCRSAPTLSHDKAQHYTSPITHLITVRANACFCSTTNSIAQGLHWASDTLLRQSIKRFPVMKLKFTSLQYFDIFLPATLWSPKLPLPVTSSNQNYVRISCFPIIRGTCLAHLILLELTAAWQISIKYGMQDTE
jgi:hypothetical protein